MNEAQLWLWSASIVRDPMDVQNRQLRNMVSYVKYLFDLSTFRPHSSNCEENLTLANCASGVLSGANVRESRGLNVPRVHRCLIRSSLTTAQPPNLYYVWFDPRTSVIRKA